MELRTPLICYFINDIGHELPRALQNITVALCGLITLERRMTIGIGRRLFISALGGVAAWPLAVRAQQAAMPLIGFVHSASPTYFGPFGDAFHTGLKEAGYIENQNVKIEYRWAEGDYRRLPALVADLLARKVDVLFAAGGTDPTKAAEAATTTIPIVFVSAADPVRNGLVASLNRPDGNVTGVSLLASALDGKKLDLLHRLVPQASVVATLVNPNYPDAKAQAADFQAAAVQLGIRPFVLSAATDADFEAAFATLKEQHIDAIVLGNDPFFGAERNQLIALAARYAVPMIFWQREFAIAGGLLSYGPDFVDGYRQGGVYVGKILKGDIAPRPVIE
jgi:putative ABC transport system substrate-binding protein